MEDGGGMDRWSTAHKLIRPTVPPGLIGGGGQGDFFILSRSGSWAPRYFNLVKHMLRVLFVLTSGSTNALTTHKDDRVNRA